jgi:hypothetical protein
VASARATSRASSWMLRGILRSAAPFISIFVCQHVTASIPGTAPFFSASPSRLFRTRRYKLARRRRVRLGRLTT